ncbi:hypothetical protein NLX67_17215 [Domibacillus sp. A3M-37]|uniref:hypothetical protein n=1 Tax=Domibacillus sp. A3M-37 TaxID=2962037 RepID=UPI0020B8DB28|nr:hypothetical protein [Domibacillus sp. A3M-37]MCP3764093.1 hypothetical protein [Domibacillus sp. A3M-37]
MNNDTIYKDDDDFLWTKRDPNNLESLPIYPPATTYSQLNDRYNQLIDLIKSIDEVQAGTIKELFQIKPILEDILMKSSEYQTDMEEIKTKGPQMSAQHIDFYTKMELNFNFPYMKKTRENKRSYYEAIRTVYSRFMTGELDRQLEHEPVARYPKSFVLIVHYFKGNRIQDLDNHFSSFVFNVLRYKNLIEDDSWMNMSYMEKGLPAEEGKTELYICNQSDGIDLFETLKLGQ